MEKILSDKIIAAIHEVGELVRSDERYTEMVRLSSEYNTDKELQGMLDSYAEKQRSLSAEFEKTETDDDVIKKIQSDMDALYTSIVGNKVYNDYKEAYDLYQEFTEELYSELEFAVTGRRSDSCTHDCSSCSGCC